MAPLRQGVIPSSIILGLDNEIIHMLGSNPIVRINCIRKHIRIVCLHGSARDWPLVCLTAQDGKCYLIGLTLAFLVTYSAQNKIVVHSFSGIKKMCNSLKKA